MKIEYKEVNMDTVLRYFQDGFKTIKGQEHLNFGDTFIDTMKRKVIFQVYLDNDEITPSLPTIKKNYKEDIHKVWTNVS
jgi:hypothetical protein